MGSKEKAEEVQIVLIPAEAFGVDGCWTIDSNTANDNGFLVCARVGHPGVGHGNTNQAVNNLLGCLPSSLAQETADIKKIANIVGHGNDGLIVTGTGQLCCPDLNKVIAWFNGSFWQADIRRLNGKVSILRLWTCHAGTGQVGVNLLNNLSQASGAICMAPTGFTYCSGGNFKLEDGSTFQVVVPGQPLPAPINAPTPHLVQKAVDNMKIRTEKDYETIPLEDVDEVDISDPSLHATKVLRDEKVKDFLQVINFDSPFVIEGVPAAIVTANIRLHFKEPAASRIGTSRNFIVWNDRQIEDAEKRGNFYNVLGDLRSLMRMI